MSEVVVSAASDGTCALWELASGAPLVAYRECAAQPRGLAITGGAPAPGLPAEPEYLLAAQVGRPAVNVWGVQRDAPLYKCALAEPMLCVAASRDGALCVAGGASGKCYVWDACTGELLRVWSAHYKGVSAAAFLPGDDVLVTGGHDGVVHAWDTAGLVDVAALGDVTRAPAPHVSWSDHSLPVTSVRVCAAGLGAAAPVVTASLDRTARVWDVASRRCLLRVACPSPVHVAAADAAGHQLFMGCADGAVYVVDLHAAAAAALAPGATIGRPPAAAVVGGGALLGAYAAGAGGGGGGGAPATHAAGARAFVGHLGAVADVAFGSGGELLVTASDDGSVRVWDVASRQQLRAFDGHRGAAVGAVLVLPRPPSLPPAAGGGGAAAPAPARAAPLLPLAPLRKHAVPLPLDWRGSGTGPLDREVVLRLAPVCGGGSGGDGAAGDAVNAAFRCAVRELLAECRGAAGAAAGSAAGAPAAADAAADPGAAALDALRAQVAALTDENARWKAVNNKLVARLQDGAGGGSGAAAAAPGDGSGKRRRA